MSLKNIKSPLITRYPLLLLGIASHVFSSPFFIVLHRQLRVTVHVDGDIDNKYIIDGNCARCFPEMKVTGRPIDADVRHH